MQCFIIKKKDVTLNIIEVLLSMRSDLDKRSIKEALEGCSKILEQNKEMINNNTQKLGNISFYTISNDLFIKVYLIVYNYLLNFPGKKNKIS